jgi:CHAT domain-containing protein/tetratricopeptide (TPR) repeat protein
MRARIWGVGVLLGAMLSGAWLAAGRQRVASDSSPAARLHLAALDRLLALDTRGASALLRAAVRTDPGYLAAWLELDAIGDAGGPDVAAFFDSSAGSPMPHGLSECIGIMGRYPRGLALSRPGHTQSEDARLCLQYVAERSADRSLSKSPASGARLRQRYGWTPAVAQMLETDSAEQRVLLERYRVGHLHPLAGLIITARHAVELHRLGRDSEALALERELERSPRWSDPASRFWYRLAAATHEQLLRPETNGASSRNAHARSVVAAAHAELLNISRAGADPLMVTRYWTEHGSYLVDRGRVAEGHALLIAAARLADSLGNPGYQAQSHLRIGRALVKMGQLLPAELELTRARKIARDMAHPAHEKEAAHNLLHLYEARHDDAKALRAGLDFVRLASIPGLSAVRMISQHDVANFLRTRGRMEEARPFIAGMLADIDSLGREYYFAGEYYESIGNLDRAEHYYRLGLPVDQAPVRSLAGMTRVAFAKGRSIDAVTYARQHDGLLPDVGVPESEAILPGLLIAMGRRQEGRASLQRSRDVAAEKGQTAAWASQTLEMAEVVLDDGQFAVARHLADSARVAASRVGAGGVALRARGLAALASIRGGGDRTAGGVELDGVIVAARVSGEPRLESQVEALRGRSLAAGPEWRRALDHFARSAMLLDRIAAELALDPERAGFRSTQRRVYDEAFGAIIDHRADPEALDLFLEWSRRRKTRGMVAAPGAVAARTVPGPRQVMLDFVVLDHRVAVAVVSAAGAEIIPLAVDADSLRRMVQAFREAMNARIGSQWDLAHASFSVEQAHALYRALLLPVAHLTPPGTGLTILPDGPLHLVPFDALVSRVDSGAHGGVIATRYVIDDHAVRESLSNGRGAPSTRARRRVLVVAPQTHGVDGTGEIEAILRRFGAPSVDVLQGPKAVERAVREQIANAAIVHFAADARINVVAPSSSALRLLADGDDDGDFHAFEVVSLPLAGATVVLSACETGAGPLLEGEGVLSLSRSFFQAGAVRTVATLWPIGAETSRFMGRFYDALGDERDAAAALHAAKLASRRAGESPLYWGSFIMMERFASLR